MVNPQQPLPARVTRSSAASGVAAERPDVGRTRSSKRQKENIVEGPSSKRSRRSTSAVARTRNLRESNAGQSAPTTPAQDIISQPCHEDTPPTHLSTGASEQSETETTGDPATLSGSPDPCHSDVNSSHPLEPETDPHLLWFDPCDSTKVQEAKAVLQVSAETVAPTPLGRDSQYRKMEEVLKVLVSEGRGGSLYVSGLPGTGKTYTIGKLLKHCSAWAADPVSVVWLNCMSLSQPKQVFQRLLQGVVEAGSRSAQACRANPIIMPGAGDSDGAKDGLEGLRTALGNTPVAPPSKKGRRKSLVGGASSSRMVVAVLDEMDCLQTGDQAVLSELFQLAAGSNTRLVLIGISNSIDLTDRTLPHLEQLGISPAVVPFPAYSATALFELLKERLEQLPGPVLAEPAMQFASRKVGSGAGDMRQLLQASQCAIDNAATEAKEKASAAKSDPDATDEDVSAKLKKPRLVGIVHMASGIAQLQGQCGVQGGVRSIESLSREQQTVLCAVVNCHNDHQKLGSTSITAATSIKPRRLSGAFRQFKNKPFAKAKGPQRLSLSGFAPTDKTKDFTMADVHDTYRKLTRTAQVPMMRPCEFSSVCSNLADQALIQVSQGMHDRMRRVSLKISQDDVIMALQGINFFRRMLEQ